MIYANFTTSLNGSHILKSRYAHIMDDALDVSLVRYLTKQAEGIFVCWTKNLQYTFKYLESNSYVMEMGVLTHLHLLIGHRETTHDLDKDCAFFLNICEFVGFNY